MLSWVQLSWCMRRATNAEHICMLDSRYDERSAMFCKPVHIVHLRHMASATSVLEPRVWLRARLHSSPTARARQVTYAVELRDSTQIYRRRDDLHSLSSGGGISVSLQCCGESWRRSHKGLHPRRHCGPGVRMCKTITMVTKQRFYTRPGKAPNYMLPRARCVPYA